MADGQSNNPSGDKKNMSCYSWQNLPLNVISPFKSYRTFKGEKIKVLLLTLHPGHIGEKHRHQSEQISYILKGKMKVKLGEKEEIVHAGDLIHIPENLPHQTETLGEETIILEIFSPAEYQKEILE
jgi:quercetin dioxygenase-like cupin family protein